MPATLPRFTVLLALGLCGLTPAWATESTQPTAWQVCAAQADETRSSAQRLACFDAWARQQATSTATTAATPSTASPTPATRSVPAQAARAPAVPGNTHEAGCRNSADSTASEMSRLWELEAASDCGTFGIRGYRPISLSWIGATDVNQAPQSPSPGHSAAPVAYSADETRIQLSVRTKLAQGLLTGADPLRRDSLWFGYTQQSYWQLFNGAISRPFRNTDHEPELVYVYPNDAGLPGQLRWRYSGLGLVHQSNGQSLPLSRSWNRVYLMGGLEWRSNWRLSGRVWQRINENPGNDDNPDISNTVGRSEWSAAWDWDSENTLSGTLRHSLRAEARGSTRLEWLRRLGHEHSGLRWHTQLFSGYGDSLVDYNRRRKVLSLGLSLVDF